jgi:phosphatidylglycerophosphatase A
MKRRIVESLATGLYLGKIPFAPGTWGTLLGIPLAWVLMKTGPVPYMVIAVVLVLFASVIAELHERYTKAHDPKEIVIDEIVGYVIAITWLPQTWQSYLAAFIAFRFFDILKPPPIRQIDQKIEGGLGTVLDDVAAGLAANIILQIVATQTTWLGVQLR